MSERPTPGDRERKAPVAPLLGGGVSMGSALVPAASRVAVTDPVDPPTTSNVICWGKSRLRQALPRVVSRCMSYSAAPQFDEALVAAVSRFYGIDVDVPTAETEVLEDDFERVRFFPWFLWDFPLPSGSPSLADATIGSRFLDEAELGDFEREVLRALIGSALAFVEVMAVDAEGGELVVIDLQSGHPVRVFDPGLAAELQVGHIALVRLLRFGPGVLGHARSSRELDGDSIPEDGAVDAIYAVLPNETRPLVEMELERLLGGEREPLAVLKSQAPEILDFAEHVLSTLTAPASPLNADREPIVLCQTVVSGPTGERVMELVSSAESVFFAADASLWPGLHLWREDERVVAIVRVDKVDLAGGPRVALMASSRERFDRVTSWCERGGISVPHLRSESELESAVPTWLARGEPVPWLVDPDIARAFGDGLSRWLSLWPDAAHPAISGRSPRDLATDDEGLQVVSRLIGRVRCVVGEAALPLESWLAIAVASTDKR